MAEQLKYHDDLVQLFAELLSTKLDKAIFQIIVSAMDDDEKLDRIIALLEKGSHDKD